MSKTVVFHYARPNEDYEGWRLKTRVDEADEFVSYDPHRDAFGLVWKVEFEDDVTTFRYRLDNHDARVLDPDGRSEQIVNVVSEGEDVELWYVSEFAVDGEARFLNVPHPDDEVLDLHERVDALEQAKVESAAALGDVQDQVDGLAEAVDILVKLSTTPVVKPTHIEVGDLTPVAERARDAIGFIGTAVVDALNAFRRHLPVTVPPRGASRSGGDARGIGTTEQLLIVMESTANDAHERYSSIVNNPGASPTLLPATLATEIRGLGKYCADTVERISRLALAETDADRVKAHTSLLKALRAPDLVDAINQLRNEHA